MVCVAQFFLHFRDMPGPWRQLRVQCQNALEFQFIVFGKSGKGVVIGEQADFVRRCKAVPDSGIGFSNAGFELLEILV